MSETSDGGMLSHPHLVAPRPHLLHLGRLSGRLMLLLVLLRWLVLLLLQLLCLRLRRLRCSEHQAWPVHEHRNTLLLQVRIEHRHLLPFLTPVLWIPERVHTLLATRDLL